MRDYSNYNKDAFKYQLRNTPWENCLKHPNINSAWNSFKNNLTTIVNTHAPLVEKASSWKRKSVDESRNKTQNKFT